MKLFKNIESELESLNTKMNENNDKLRGISEQLEQLDGIKHLLHTIDSKIEE
jgi:DNA repair exonuclease SbcCD ATPase subunit